MKILVVEDDPVLRPSIQSYLSENGHQVETAADFLTGFHKTIDSAYDCVLVDLTIPGGNGLSLVKSIKKYRPATGVIIISGKNSTDDKVNGLELGADDYLAKPFHLSELNARINSVGRRITPAGATGKIEVGVLQVNTDAQTVSVNNQRISLTPKEYDLLLFFIQNREGVLSKDTIAGRLLTDDVNLSYDFIYTHIKNLRKKLTEHGCSQYIQAVYGTGYRFSVQ